MAFFAGFQPEKTLVRQSKSNSSVPASESLDFQGVTAWATVQGRTNFLVITGSEERLSIAHFNGPYGETIVTHRHSDKSVIGATPVKIRFFVYSEKLWLMVNYKYLETEQSRVILYLVNSTSIQPRLSLPGSDVDIDLFTHGQTKQTYWALYNSSTISLYQWDSTTFDKVATRELTHKVNAIKIFSIGDAIYIATAQAYSHSQLLSYSEVTRQLNTMQFLQTTSQFDKLQYFTVGGNSYLLFVGPDPGIIFWWSGQGFIAYQELVTRDKVIDVSSLRLVDGEVVLGLMYRNRIEFLTQGLDSHFKTVHNGVLPAPVTLKSIHLVSYFGQFLYAFVGGDNTHPVWKLRLYPRSPPRQTDPLHKCILQLSDLIQAREGRLKDLSSRANRLWVSDRPQTISAPVIVHGSIHSQPGTFHVNEVIITTNATDLPQVTSTEVKSRIDAANIKINHLRKELPYLARRDRSNVIAGRVTFQRPIIARTARLNRISNPSVTINGVSFDNLNENILTLDGDQTIQGKWTFANGLKADTINLAGKINGMRVSDILMRDSPSPQSITGQLTFKDVNVTRPLTWSATSSINGMPFADIVTTRDSKRPQILNGLKRFVNVKAPSIRVSGNVNDYQIDSLVNRAVRLNSPKPQVLTGSITFETPIHVDSLNVAGYINNRINVSRMMAHGVTRSNSRQVITGTTTFAGRVEVKGSVTVSGLINDLDFANDIVSINRPENITTPIIFRSPVIVNGALETGTVNGIDLSVEALRRSSINPQVITARKGFLQGLNVKGNITMAPGSTIDEVDPSDLAMRLVKSRDVTLNGPLIFDSLSINGTVIARKGINGHMISDLPNKVWFKSLNQTIQANSVSTSTHVMFKSLSANEVNRMKLPEQFVLKNSPVTQTITGHKSFVGDVILTGPGISTNPQVKMNGLDINEFSRRFVSRLNASTIADIKYFNELHVTGNIYCTRVNRLDLKKDVMISSLNQTVNSPIVFTAPTVQVDQIHVQGDVGVTNTVNNVRLADWVKNVVTVDSIRDRPLQYKDFDNLQTNSLELHGRINGIDFDDFARRVVTLRSPQVITASQNFLGNVHFASNVHVDYLNGFNYTDHIRRVVTADRESVITGRKIIKGNLIIQGRDLIVRGLVNRVNLTDLAKNAFSLTKSNVMTAPLTVMGDVRMNDLVLSPSSLVDGIRLDDLVYLDQPGTVQSHLTFEDDVKVDGNINVDSGIVNSCDLRQLQTEALPLNLAKAVINGHTLIEMLHIKGHLDVDKSINGVNIKETIPRIASLINIQAIKSPVDFTDEVTVDNLVVTDTVNGFNLTQIFTDAVRTNVPSQVVRGKKTFVQDIRVFGGIASFNVLNVKGTVNSVNITELRYNSVYKNGSQIVYGRKRFQAPVTFEKSINVAGRVGDGANMYRIPDDLILLNSSRVIHVPGQTVLKGGVVRVLRSINSTGLIDSVDTESLSKQRISLQGDQASSGQFQFTGPVNIDNLYIRRSINGIPIGDLVTKSGNHVLKGSYTFNQGILVNGNLDLGPNARVNGVPISDVASKAIDIRKGGTISGTTHLISHADLGSAGLDTQRLNGLSVDVIKNHFSNYSNVLSTKVTSLRDQINSQSQLIKGQIASVGKLSTTINYIDNHIEFHRDEHRMPITYTKIIPVIVRQFNNSSPFNPSEYLIAHKLIEYDRKYKSCRLIKSVLMREIANEPVHQVLDGLHNGGFNPVHPVSGFTRCPPFFLSLSSSQCSRELQLLTSQLINNDDPLAAAPRFDGFPHAIFNSSIVNALGFTHGPDDFLVIALYNHWRPDLSRVFLFYYSPSQMSWTLSQSIKALGPSAIDLIITKDVWLAVANQLTYHGSPSASMIFKLNRATRQFVSVQTIPSWSPSAIKFISSVPSASNSLYLVIANEKAQLFGGDCPDESDVQFPEAYTSFLTQSVVIYKQIGSSFQPIQDMNLPGVTSVDAFYLPPSGLYLLAGSKPLGRSYLYQLRGVNLFQQINSFTTIGVEHIRSYWSPTGDLRIAVSSSVPEKSQILAVILSGPSIQLRSILPSFP